MSRIKLKLKFSGVRNIDLYVESNNSRLIIFVILISEHGQLKPEDAERKMIAGKKVFGYNN